MKINTELIEQADHGHYMVCLERMKSIERLSKRIFIFAVIEASAMFFMTIFGLRISVFSLIPSLFGDKFSIGYMASQIIEAILIPVLAFDSYIGKKIYNVIIFAIHCIMMVICFTGGFEALDTYSFLISVAGIIVTFPSISAYFDYEQLKNTEGFPQFSNLLVDAEDNPEFVSDYGEEYKKKSSENMFVPVPENTVTETTNISKEITYMDDIFTDTTKSE